MGMRQTVIGSTTSEIEGDTFDTLVTRLHRSRRSSKVPPPVLPPTVERHDRRSGYGRRRRRVEREAALVWFWFDNKQPMHRTGPNKETLRFGFYEYFNKLKHNN